MLLTFSRLSVFKSWWSRVWKSVLPMTLKPRDAHMNFTYCLTIAASAKGIARVCWSLPLLTQGVCQQMVFLWRVAWRVHFAQGAQHIPMPSSPHYSGPYTCRASHLTSCAGMERLWGGGFLALLPRTPGPRWQSRQWPTLPFPHTRQGRPPGDSAAFNLTN